MDGLAETGQSDLGTQIEATGRGHEKMERTEAVSKFAVNFLRTFNPTVDEERIQAELFGDPQNNIFSGTVEEQLALYERRKQQGGVDFAGYDSMLRLSRFYVESNDTLPDRVIAITNHKQLKDKNFQNLFVPGEKALIYYFTAPYSKNQVLDLNAIAGIGEKPDVMLSEINEESMGGLGGWAESFSLSGAKNVFLRSPEITKKVGISRIKPDFTLSISCTGVCEIMPTILKNPDKKIPLLYIEAGTVRQPSGTTFAPTEVVCNTYERIGGNIINAHPEQKVKIKIRGGIFDDKSGEKPLDPRYFEVIGDPAYEKLQQEYRDTLVINQMGVPGESVPGEDHKDEEPQEGDVEPAESHTRDEWRGIFNERHGKFADGVEAEVADEDMLVIPYTVPVDQMTGFLRDARAAGLVVNGIPRGDGFISVTVEQEPEKE